MSPSRHRHIPYAYPKGKKVPKGRRRSEILLSSMDTSEKCSGWHRQVPHHPGDGLSYPQDSFIAVHQAAQHPRLPGQGGGKSNSKQEADPTFFQHSRAGVDGSGQQHLHASAVDLKSLISHGLWGVWLGRKAKNSKRTNSANLSASNLNRSCPGGCPRPWRRGWLRLDNIGTSVQSMPCFSPHFGSPSSTRWLRAAQSWPWTQERSSDGFGPWPRGASTFCRMLALASPSKLHNLHRALQRSLKIIMQQVWT